MRNFADGNTGLFVLCCCLRFADCVEGNKLAVVEARVLAVRGEAYRGWGDAVEFCKGGYGGVPPGCMSVNYTYLCWLESFLHLCSFLWCDVWDRRVLEDAPIEEFHDVEVGADHAFILTETVGFRYWYICVFEGVDDSVFAIDFMSSLSQSAWYQHVELRVVYLGKKLTRRLLPHNIFLSILVRQLIRRV